MDLQPCRVCRQVPVWGFRSSTVDDRVRYTTHECAGPYRADRETAAAEWNAANAAPDPALLALAKFGADVIASHRSPMGRWAQPSSLALPDIARDIGVTVSGQLAPGIASAIARLVATDEAGEVTDA